MFAFFKSSYGRAVDASAEVIALMTTPLGERIPEAVLRDPYCIGFLQMVGMHVAARSVDPRKASAAFADALKVIAPACASGVVELLSRIGVATSPQCLDYLRGKKDGDLYMGYELLRLAPQQDGEGALRRFFERAQRAGAPAPGRSQESPCRMQQPPVPRSEGQSESSRSPTGGIETDEWKIVQNDLVRQYIFTGLPLAERLLFQIRIGVEIGGFGIPCCHPNFIIHPPVSPKRKMSRIILFNTEDGSVDPGPIETIIMRTSDRASRFWFQETENAEKIFTVLRAMKRMHFALIATNGKDIELSLSLENDQSFEGPFCFIQDEAKAAADALMRSGVM
jgi:hypothetical protein